MPYQRAWSMVCDSLTASMAGYFFMQVRSAVVLLTCVVLWCC
jgi:hypothetical protein